MGQEGVPWGWVQSCGLATLQGGAGQPQGGGHSGTGPSLKPKSTVAKTALPGPSLLGTLPQGRRSAVEEEPQWGVLIFHWGPPTSLSVTADPALGSWVSPPASSAPCCCLFSPLGPGWGGSQIAEMRLLGPEGDSRTQIIIPSLYALADLSAAHRILCNTYYPGLT